jgi:hypothetical protein
LKWEESERVAGRIAGKEEKDEHRWRLVSSSVL